MLSSYSTEFVSGETGSLSMQYDKDTSGSYLIHLPELGQYFSLTRC